MRESAASENANNRIKTSRSFIASVGHRVRKAGAKESLTSVLSWGTLGKLCGFSGDSPGAPHERTAEKTHLQVYPEKMTSICGFTQKPILFDEVTVAPCVFDECIRRGGDSSAVGLQL